MTTLEVLYFHRSYDNKNSGDISDVGYWHNSTCSDKILRPDPLYMNAELKPIRNVSDVSDIRYVTLGFCRPNFRKFIFSEKNEQDMIIYHFYIQKIEDGKRKYKYVCSFYRPVSNPTTYGRI